MNVSDDSTIILNGSVVNKFTDSSLFVNVELPKDAGGNLTFNIYENGILIGNSTSVLPKNNLNYNLDKITDYNVEIKYSGDNNYYSSLFTFKVDVKQLLINATASFIDNDYNVADDVINNSNKAPLSFEEFMEQSGLNVEDIKSSTYGSGEKELYGRELNKSDIRNNERANNKLPYENDYIFDKYKRWLNSYKKGLTVYNPGWHFQNFFQNKGQNFLALGMDAFKPQTEAKKILNYINGEKAKDIKIFDRKNKELYSVDEMAKLAQELGVTDGLGEDVKNARGIFSSLENYIDNTPLMKSLEKNEQTARLHHFVKQIEKGMSPEDAAKSVNKYLFDYSKKNKVDKVISDFIDPFWTFHKNNARLMYTSGIEHSDKIAKINRATKGLEEGIPEEQLQNEGSKYGKLQKPYLNYKDSVNKDDYNYLYNQNIMPDFEDAFPFSQKDLENKLNPLLRLAMQQSRGEGNFGNKIVKGDKAGWNEITEKIE